MTETNTKLDTLESSIDALLSIACKGFMTCDCANGESAVVVSFRSLEETQEFHRALIRFYVTAQETLGRQY